jgi:hypothetical protein
MPPYSGSSLGRAQSQRATSRSPTPLAFAFTLPILAPYVKCVRALSPVDAFVLSDENSCFRLIVDTLKNYVFTPEIISLVLRESENALFPDGHSPPPLPEPNSEEREQLYLDARSELASFISETLPRAFFSFALPVLTRD